MMKNILITATALVLMGSVAACQIKSASSAGSTRLFSLDTEVKQALAEGSNPAQLCGYLKQNGYFPSNSYAPGTKVLYSTDYGMVRDAAGQAWGVVGADGFFEQRENVTTQLLLCPGSVGLNSGKCLWKINGDDGYAQLAYDVVCNRRARNPGAVHPGYSSQKASLVSYHASTSGDSVSGTDAVEVILEGRVTKTRIVFAKNVGLVATVFQESSMPDGTAEVFIGGTATATAKTNQE